MSIKKVFKQHFKLVFNDKGQRECQCGFFIGNGDNAGKLHKKHAIQVLEQHVQEREVKAKAEALLAARDRMANHWPLALDEFEAGEVCDWLEREADKIREAH